MINMSPEELSILILSLKVGFFSALYSLIPGILIGYLLARKEFYGKVLIDSIVYLPLVLPPVTIGYFLIILFGNQGIIGKFLHEWFGLTLIFNWKGAVLASSIMGFPLLVRAVRISIESIDLQLEKTAASLGASPLKVFLSITLPLALPGVIAGVILSFARSLGEFGATITFVSNIPNQTRTLPIAIYTYSQMPGNDLKISRLIFISIIISFTALFFSNLLEKKIKRKS
ncbi:MAG: molybdate ABC transporter permease subunit [Candidatus Sericytochromatia bacterium]|nr:molybdate ABC transporter permease subunit [Candidatus Sericytochromatia bacterium]